jgi:hypothetical protein
LLRSTVLRDEGDADLEEEQVTQIASMTGHTAVRAPLNIGDCALNHLQLDYRLSTRSVGGLLCWT